MINHPQMQKSPTDEGFTSARGAKKQQTLGRSPQAIEDVWPLQGQDYHFFHLDSMKLVEGDASNFVYRFLCKFQPCNVVPSHRLPLVHYLVFDHFHHLAVNVLVPIHYNSRKQCK